MWRNILVCGGLVGCGFHAEAADTAGHGPGDAAVDDSATTGDAGGDAGAVATTCMQRWLAGTVQLVTPQPLPSQSSSAPPDDERDPWVSSDGLSLYYAVDPMGGAKSDVFLATRATTADAFGKGTKLVNLNTANADEGRVSLTEDQKLLAVATNKDSGNQSNIELASRSSTTMMFPSADGRLMDNINTSNTNHFDPFLTRDGLKLYLSPAPAAQDQRIFVATRTAITAAFDAPTAVNVINSTAAGVLDGDPAVSLDDRIIVFSSTRPMTTGATDTNLWYATRASPGDDFGTPRPIPDINSPSQDGDPMLSADGCTLYFASRRAGTYDLYSATQDLTSTVAGREGDRRSD